MTTKQAAELVGYTRHGAWCILCDISAYVPIVQDDTKAGSLWYLDYEQAGRMSK